MSRVPGSGTDRYLVTEEEKRISLFRANLETGALVQVRSWERTSWDHHIEAREPGLVYVMQNPRFTYSYMDPATDRVLERHDDKHMSSGWDSHRFPGQQLPLDRYAVGGNTIDLMWDSPKRRFAYRLGTREATLLEFKPGTWEESAKIPLPDALRGHVLFHGNPDKGCFTLSRSYDWQGQDAVTTKWFSSDLKPLNPPYDWVFDIGPNGALVATSKKSRRYFKSPPLGLLAIDPLSNRIIWRRMDLTGNASWMGDFVLFYPQRQWPSQGGTFQFLDGSTGKTVLEHRFGEGERLMGVFGTDLIFEQVAPPAIHVWRLRP